MTLVANAVAPGLLDRYLARTGIDSQQATAPCDPDQAENLWTPADLTRDFGINGRFDEQAKTRSTQVWASQHHGLLAALSGGAFVGAGAVARVLRRRTV